MDEINKVCNCFLLWIYGWWVGVQMWAWELGCCYVHPHLLFKCKHGNWATKLLLCPPPKHWVGIGWPVATTSCFDFFPLCVFKCEHGNWARFLLNVSMAIGRRSYCYVHHHLPAVQAFSSCLDLTVGHNLVGSNITVIELGANVIFFGQIWLQSIKPSSQAFQIEFCHISEIWTYGRFKQSQKGKTKPESSCQGVQMAAFFYLSSMSIEQSPLLIFYHPKLDLCWDSGFFQTTHSVRVSHQNGKQSKSLTF